MDILVWKVEKKCHGEVNFEKLTSPWDTLSPEWFWEKLTLCNRENENDTFAEEKETIIHDCVEKLVEPGVLSEYYKISKPLIIKEITSSGRALQVSYFKI